MSRLLKKQAPLAYAREAVPSLSTAALSPAGGGLACTLPSGELAQLCRAIEQSLPGQPNPVVQFASSYSGEGTERIAFETAVAAASLMGRRVLFIDAAGQGGPRTAHGGAALGNPPPSGGMLSDAVMVGHDTNLLYTVLRRHDGNGSRLTSMQSVRELLERLRPAYDLIIIDSSAIPKDVFGMALAALADGTILVIQAERTRAPVVLQTRETIHKHGGTVLGAVLNDRILHIPNPIYRKLYRGGM